MYDWHDYGSYKPECYFLQNPPIMFKFVVLVVLCSRKKLTEEAIEKWIEMV